MVIRYVMAEYPHETCMEEDDVGNYVLHSDYAALEARVAELEKDAERYRWIRKNCDSLETPDSTIQGWIFVNNGCTNLDCWVDKHLSREA